MHLLYLTTEDLSKARSSGKVHFFAIVEELLKQGHEVTILSPDYRNGEFAIPAGARHIHHRAPAKNALGLFVYELQLLIALVSIRRRERPDVLLVRGGSAGWLMGPIFLLSRLLGVPVVLECNGIHWDEFRRRGYSRFVQWHVKLSAWQQALLANRIIGVSDEVTAAYARLGHKSLDHVTTIPNGVDPDMFVDAAVLRQRQRRRLGIEESQLVVGYSGTFAPWHNVPTIIEAAAILQERGVSDVSFLLVGSGEQFSAVRDLCQRQDVRSVILHGAAADRNELVALCSCFDVGLCTNIVMHGSPLKFFEYLALGVPIVGSGFPQVIELIRRERAGIAIPDSSPDALADSIARIDASRQEWRAVGVRNQETARRYSWENAAKQVSEVLDDALGSGKK